MQKPVPSTELQTPAKPPAHDSGAGGSYQIVDGQPVLVSRTEGASVSRKAPLTDVDGNPVEPASE